MNATPILEPSAAYALWAGSYPAHAHNPVMLAEERAMLGLLPGDLRGQSVVDAGCGSGRYTRHAVERGAARVRGVDLSPEMLERAAAALADTAALASVELGQGDLESLPLPSDEADITLCGLVIGHLRRLEPPLAELAG